MNTLETLENFEKKGLPNNVWQSLLNEFQASEDPNQWLQNIQSQFPKLADLALISGKYELAIHLGCSNPLLQFKALYLAGQKKSAEQLLNQQPGILDLMWLRINNESLLAFEKYHNQISTMCSDLSNEIKLEVLMQWSLVLYSLGKWTEVIDTYKLIFNEAEKNDSKFYQVIAAFNLATAFQNLNQKLESKTWLWVCQNKIENLNFDHLKNSMQLFELQSALKESEFEQVSLLSKKYLASQDLNVLQKIKALHALAESQSELGEVFEAEMTLSQSRQFLLSSRIEQFMPEQEILELNLISLQHRPSRFQIKKVLENPNLKLEYKAAVARWAFKTNDMSKTIKLSLEIQKQDPENFEDLYVLLSNRLEHPGKKPRTIEHQIFKCWLSKQWKGLDYLQTYLEIEKSISPWKKALFHLTAGIGFSLQQDRPQAIFEWSAGLDIAKSSGLERLETLFCFLLQNNPDRFTLSPEEVAFYESLVNKINIQPIKISKNEKGHLNANSELSDLIFDENKNEVLWQEKSISFQQQPLLKRILIQLFEKPSGVTKEELIANVWGLEYHPLHHDPMIYSAISRLRDLVPIEKNDLVYKIPATIKWTFISTKKENTLSLSVRQKSILQLLEINEVISRREVVESLKVSDRTALRELTSLVRMGLLNQSGAGRGVHYLKWNQGA